LNALFERHPRLAGQRENIEKTLAALIGCFEGGGKLLLCGNGGSCADCEHIVGELMKGFLECRPLSPDKRAEMQAASPDLEEVWLDRLQAALPAISLPSFAALNSAFCNDVDPELVYAQPLMGLGRRGDLLLCISTSGNSANVCAAAAVARGLGVTVIGLTGEDGGRLRSLSDLCICVPERETYKVQELHLPVYHYLCAAVEQRFFGTEEA
jgi:D-sedoheptulose 7-phosphate isomerase